MRNTGNDYLRAIPDTDIICFTDGSVINPDNHGMGRCGAGIIIYKDSLEHEPITIEEKVSQTEKNMNSEHQSEHLKEKNMN